MHEFSSSTFVSNIQNQRYRGGILNGYCSRLHYFSDWIDDNQERGNVRNITSDLGKIKINKNFYFMMQNWQSYPQLVENEANRKCIAKVE